MLLAARRPHLPSRAELARAAPSLVVAAAAVFYFARFALLSVQVQDNYGAPGFDMGIFDQGVWLLSRFQAPFVTVMGRNLFGDHTSFVVLLAVPLYWVWPEAQTLLVLQAALIAAAAVPVYLYARRRLGDDTAGGDWMAAALAGAYLLNPALQHGNLEQFHPESFLVLFAALATYAALEWKPRLLLPAVVGCLLVKEDTALLVVPLGLWVAWRRDRRWGERIVAGAAAYMAFAYFAVIGPILGTTTFYMDRIPFGGLDGLIRAPFAHPARFWEYIRGNGRPFYLWQMGSSFGWVFLLAPEVAAIGLLSLAENVLSTFPYQHQIFYHYSLPLVPVLALGTAFAVGRLASRRGRRIASVAVMACAFASSAVWGLLPIESHPMSGGSGAADHAAVLATDRVLRSVPPDAVVSAYTWYVSHLDHRKDCYQWPTPFYATDWGLYTQEGQRLPVAGTVQYLVLPSKLTGTDLKVFSSISGRFHLVASGGGTSVYRRDALSAGGPG